MLLYHMVEQLRWLGSLGMLHEGVVEAFHCLDNGFVRRYACVTNRVQNLLLRARAAWQVCKPGTHALRELDYQWGERRRRRVSQVGRACRKRWQRRRAQRAELRELWRASRANF